MQTMPLYQRLAALLAQRGGCASRNNVEWFEKSTDNILELVKNKLPSGSGFDKGTKIDLDRSTPEKLVFDVGFHHMDEHGSYAGWTDHTIIVRPSLFDKFTVSVGGRNRNNIKDYIHDTFYWVLREEVTQ